MFVLHHHPFVPGCRFVRLVLDELQVPYELVYEPYWEARPDFAALNPALTVPVALDELGPPIAGATVIQEYLEETRGFARKDLALMPDGPDHRAEVRRLVQWFMAKFEEEVAGPFVGERLLKVEIPTKLGGGAPDSQVLRVARQNVRSHLKYVGFLLSERNWLAGERMTYADLAAAAAFSAVDYLGEVPWEEDEQAKAWYARLKSRPSFRPLLADVTRAVRPAAHYTDLDF